MFDDDEIMGRAYHKAFDNLYERGITREKVPNFDNIMKDEMVKVLCKHGHRRLSKLV